MGDLTASHQIASLFSVEVTTGRSAIFKPLFALALAACGRIFELVSCIGGFLDILLLFFVALLRRAFAKNVHLVSVRVFLAV